MTAQELRRLRFVAPLRSRTPPTPLRGEIAFLPMEAIGDGTFDRSNSHHADEIVGQGYTYFEDGDVIRARVTPCFENGKGALLTGLQGGKGLGTTELFVFVPGADVDPRFLYYVVSSTDFTERGTGTIYGAHGVRRVDENFARDYRAWIPDLATQRTIADYLDRETSRIAALMAAKRRMVELLEERWIEIRRHLTQAGGSSASIQLRRIARLQAGAAFPHEHQGDTNGTILYVKVGDLSNVDEHDQLRGAANRVTTQVAAVLRSPVLPSGTIVLPKIGAALLTNRRAVLSEPSCLDQNVMGVTVEAGNRRFVYHCLSTIDLGDLSTPGPVPLLNEDVALSVRIPWPSREQQDRVVDDLDRHRQAILAPTGLLGRQIDLLRERRQALITAAVTGQFDIAEAA